MEHVQCSWCGARIGVGDGFRAAEQAGARVAAFCRLEHVVPWAIQGPQWDTGELAEPPADIAALERCAQCGTPLDGARVVLVRHRGEHRIPDAFCTVEHLAEWARAGGRFR